MSMYRGTTPSIKINVYSKLDLNEMKQIYVTLKSTTVMVTYDISQVAIVGKTIYVYPSQEDTLRFRDSVDIQVRLLDNCDRAYASSIKRLKVGKILQEGIISV